MKGSGSGLAKTWLNYGWPLAPGPCILHLIPGSLVPGLSAPDFSARLSWPLSMSRCSVPSVPCSQNSDAGSRAAPAERKSTLVL